jgi:arylsulfatase A-like enzyme
MIESLDDGVGRLLETLNDLDISDRTVVIFASDNGGLVRDASPWGPVTSNLGLRAGKGSSYEGGIRVPFIVKWPGTVQPGTVESTPIISPDIYSTILEIAGLGRNSPELQDGISLVPLLKGAGPIDREALYWHYPHYHPGGATPHGAVRVGDLKLIEFYEDARVELYDLGLDASETQNLAIRYPSQAKHLTDMLHVWRDNVGAQMPLENPDFDVERALEFTH